MTCAFCKTGTTAPGVATATFNEGATTVVVRNVPADVCGQCGEPYFDGATTARLLDVAKSAKASGATVELREYAAV